LQALSEKPTYFFIKDKVNYMYRFKNLTNTLRIITGVVIAMHGLMHIVFLSEYISGIIDQLYDVIPSESGLTIIAALLPFLDFFIGLLLLGNICTKKILWVTISISILMSFFIVLEQINLSLLYHCCVIVLSVIVYVTVKTDKYLNLVYNPKC